jgi:hypothetical protein
MGPELTFLPSQNIIGIAQPIQRPGVGTGLWEIDFLLRGIRIRNETGNAIEILGCDFSLLSSGFERKKIHYPETALRERLRELARFLPQWTLSESDKSLLRTGSREDIEIKASLKAMAASSFMGVNEFWKKSDLTDKLTLHTGQETGFLLEHFRIVSADIIDELMISLRYRRNNIERTVLKSIPIIRYKNKGSYCLPLEGSWYVMGNWTNPHDHRMMSSQEFAFDFLKFDSEPLHSSKQFKRNETCPSYGERIRSIGDGRVVDCYDKVPENKHPNTLQNKEQLFDLIRLHGLQASLFGNYIIIEHKGGEYSFYGHMIPHSQKVPRGSSVKKGQTIGYVGNSGNSISPHLHFQLMDGPDFTQARGLPCYFSNTVDFLGNKIDLINKDYSVVHSTKAT